MAKVKVAVVKGSDPAEMTERALNLVEAWKAIPPNSKVMLKPNYIIDKHPSTGVTTDARVLEGIIRFLKEHEVAAITIGEGSGFADTFKAYRLAGVDEVARRYGVHLVDLNNDEMVEVENPNALTLRKARVAKTALESLVVSVPKLKMHSISKVTLSLKNMIGVTSPKGAMHGKLDERIVDLNSVVKPRLAVVDGIIGGAGSELGGTPVNSGLGIAGRDPVAVDTVGAAIMGIDPEKVRHIQLAEDVGMGVGTLSDIEILGEPIETVKVNYESV
jgi:uncharacterized protein (DUF362 family)